jgi:hyaluronoglucosaminidase
MPGELLSWQLVGTLLLREVRRVSGLVPRRGTARLAGVLLSVIVIAACSRPAMTAVPLSPVLPGAQASATPQVTPQPQQMTRLGEDIAVRGRVEVTVDPLVDQPTRDLAVQVLRAAGAGDVVVHEPGPPTPGAALRVRLGDRGSPTVVRTLEDVGFSAPFPLPAEGYVLVARGGSEPTLALGADDPSGAYYAVQTLRQLVTPGHIAGVGIVDFPLMPTRGVVEGFYGSPWSQQQRMDQLAFDGDMKLNTYIYSPKDDPFLRDQWRQLYPPDKLGQIQQLIGQAAVHHVRFTYALSPGTSVCYSNPSDINALLAKLQSVYAAGVRAFSLPFDDISYTKWNCPQDLAAYGPPSPAAAGQAQAALLNVVQRQFVAAHPDVLPLQTVPTEYSDLQRSPYKAALTAELDPAVQVMWTGDGVVPGAVTVSQAKQSAALWGRRTLLWDNFPVNDFPATVGRLLLGPYVNRQAGLHDQLAGDVVNPMNQAGASKVAEIGVADFSWNDTAYDPQRAWQAAARYLAGGAPAGAVPDPATVDALMAFFDLEHMAPLPNGRPWQPPAPELARRLATFRTQFSSGDRTRALSDLRVYAQVIAGAPGRIRATAEPDFSSDAGPWLDATGLWSTALLSTVDALQARADGNEPRAGQLFAAAAAAAHQASVIRTIPGVTLPQGPVLVADGVLDVFVRDAPTLR